MYMCTLSFFSKLSINFANAARVWTPYFFAVSDEVSEESVTDEE